MFSSAGDEHLGGGVQRGLAVWSVQPGVRWGDEHEGSPVRAYTRRRLLASLKLGAAAVPCVVLVRLLHGLELVPGTFLVGFVGGFAVGVTELFVLRHRFKHLGFLPHLLAKSAAIMAVLFLAFAALNVLDVVIDGITWGAYFRALFEVGTILALLEGLGIIMFLLFFVHLDRLLGPGVLLGVVTGRFHRPREEVRIFMFLDLKGSTSLAEELETARYFEFMHRCFAQMSEPILETNAKIYQYVGDEVVLTWSMDEGVEEANCLRAFFLVQEQIARSAASFHAEFGHVPEFKAALHCGEVVVAQIGDLKREIVYSGDVLNTTARIQSLCNTLGQQILVSRTLIDLLQPDSEWEVENLGEFGLRGRSEHVSLCAVARSAA